MQFSSRMFMSGLVTGAFLLAQGIILAGTIAGGAGGNVSGGSNHLPDVTVGNFNSGNCYPFMCNDSGTSSGQSIDYQQVYSSSAFSGLTTINSLTWYYAATFAGNSTVLGGTYTVEWGYTNAPVNGLSTNLASNYSSGPNSLGSFNGPINDNPSFTYNGFSAFTYDPSQGNLLLEFIVTNQDISNGSGYNEADVWVLLPAGRIV